MKRNAKSILIAATILATLASTAMPVSAMAFKTAPAVALESLADVTREDGLTTVDGTFSAKKISNKKDAKAVIASIASQLGIQNVSKELAFVDASDSNEFNTVYTFQQTYQGVKVADGFVKLVVDKATKQAEYLNSSFAQLDMDVTPAISAGMASALLREKYGYGTLHNAELTIVSDQDGAHKLAWLAELPAEAAISGAFVDAQSGEIISEITDDGYTKQESYYYSAKSNNPITGTRNFTIQMLYDYDKTYNWSKHIMFDQPRNIRVVMEKSIECEMERVCNTYGQNYLNNNPKWFENNRKDWLDGYTLKHEGTGESIPNNWTTELGDQIAAGTMYQMEQVYDTFYYYYGWKGTDGNSSLLCVEPANVGGRADGDAHASCFGNYIKLGFERQDNVNAYTAAARDVAAHEYTHRISGYKAKWNFSSTQGETGCLNEGYSDILGEYADSHQDWVLGADMYKNLNWDTKYTRDYRVTLPSIAGAWYGGQIYKYTTASDFKNMECHDGSTVLSHVAYLMDKAGLSKELARKIWFTSLDYLPQGADKAKFKDARLAVFKAADKVIDSYTTNKVTRENLKMKVVHAFDEVNLHSEGSGKYRRGDLNGDGYYDVSDSIKLSTVISSHNISMTCQQLAAADVNFDGVLNSNDTTLINRAIAKYSDAVTQLTKDFNK